VIERAVLFAAPCYVKEGIVEDVILKRFERPDEVRTFDKGKFELVHIGGMTIGRATYEPGWRWSAHVGAATGAKLCFVEHVGLVVSGRATAAMEDGRVIEIKAGDLFYIAPGHDSWVVGDEPYVSLHFLGAEKYAQAKS
jgi:quercetin dioxygenase-like cupin family protein